MISTADGVATLEPGRYFDHIAADRGTVAFTSSSRQTFSSARCRASG
jgi:hypothetical protein